MTTRLYRDQLDELSPRYSRGLRDIIVSLILFLPSCAGNTIPRSEPRSPFRFHVNDKHTGTREKSNRSAIVRENVDPKKYSHRRLHPVDRYGTRASSSPDRSHGFASFRSVLSNRTGIVDTSNERIRDGRQPSTLAVQPIGEHREAIVPCTANLVLRYRTSRRKFRSRDRSATVGNHGPIRPSTILPIVFELSLRRSTRRPIVRVHVIGILIGRIET